jgi:hypothetical protein
LNGPVVTGKKEFGLLEGQGLEEGVEPGVEELVGVAGGEAAEGASPHSLPRSKTAEQISLRLWVSNIML